MGSIYFRKYKLYEALYTISDIVFIRYYKINTILKKGALKID